MIKFTQYIDNASELHTGQARKPAVAQIARASLGPVGWAGRKVGIAAGRQDRVSEHATLTRIAAMRGADAAGRVGGLSLGVIWSGLARIGVNPRQVAHLRAAAGLGKLGKIADQMANPGGYAGDPAAGNRQRNPGIGVRRGIVGACRGWDAGLASVFDRAAGRARLVLVGPPCFGRVVRFGPVVRFGGAALF